jgi:hypothetical protein
MMKLQTSFSFKSVQALYGQITRQKHTKQYVTCDSFQVRIRKSSKFKAGDLVSWWYLQADELPRDSKRFMLVVENLFFN